VIWVWVLQATNLLVDWVTGWFPEVTIPWPDSVTLQIPLPFGFHTYLTAWVVASLLVGAALLTGRVLLWIYNLLPTRGG